MAIINGTAAGETLTGTAAADTITGAGGNDKALMGAGNDVFVWNPGDGDDTIEGGTGNDTLRFKGENVHETFFILAGLGGHVLFDRTILGNDTLDLDDVERIEIQALGGADLFQIDLGGTDVKQVAIDLSNGTPGVGNGAVDEVGAFATDAINTITLTQVGGLISATGLPAQVTLAAAEATDILEIRSQAGNDKINAAALPASLLLRLNGEEGNDTIIGGAGHDSLIGGVGNDSLSGGGGNDTLDGGEGNDTVTGGAGKDLALLGGGNDLFVWNPGDGDDKVEGGNGTDTFRFIDSAVNQEINITGNGGGRTNLLADVGVVFADLNDVERIELRLLGGEDSVMVNSLVGTDITAVAVDLAATSGGAAGDRKFDRVGVEGNGDDNSIKIASVGAQVVVSGLSAQVSVVHADSTDILDIFGGAGNDAIDGSKLAAGRLALQLFGSFGNDTLIGGAGGNDYVLGGDGNDLALLGAGNDFFDWNLGDDSDTVEGQAGIDTARANGDGSADVFSVSANGARAALTDQVGNATLDLNDVEEIRIRARSGADVITVNNLSGTDIKRVSIDLENSDLALDTVTVNGTNGNDKVNVTFPGGVLFTGLPYQVGIAGTEAGKDSITFNGLGGNDTIDGSKLPAGIVQIVLDGGVGNDVITGGAGDDVVFGGADNDKLSGAAGADDLFGGDGNDVINGGADKDDLSGNNGNDTITGGTGDDIALLGAGVDLFIWNSGDGSDVIQGNADFDTLRLVGSKAGDTIGISANGTLTEIAAPGGANLDVDVERIDIRALDGADTIDIGDVSGTNVETVIVDLAATLGGKAADAKIDTVSFAATNAVDSIAVLSTKDGRVVVAAPTVEISIEHAGKTDQLVINALGGADLIDASALAAGKIALTINGGAGADEVVGSAGNDTVIGGDGNDAALLGAGNDTFIWNPGDDDDVVEGQAGFDTLRFNGIDGSEAIAVEATGGRAQLFAVPGALDLDDIERIEINALGGSDQLAVGDLSGTDVKQVAIELAAATGVADAFIDMVTINGAAGNNAITLAQGATAVTITGLSAQVTIAHANASDIIQINALGGNDSVNGATLKLTSPRLQVDGGTGNDTITGGLGNDILHGGDDNDKMLGGSGDDQLFGDNGKDVMDGGAGNDTLTGGAGNDALTGGVGNDNLTGGLGDDTMTGGTGSDTAHYTSFLDGHDVFVGFDGNAAGGQDVLNLEDLFDSLGVLTADRAARVSILDKGASVDVFLDTDGNIGNGFELTVATLQTADVVTIGQDILVGTL